MVGDEELIADARAAVSSRAGRALQGKTVVPRSSPYYRLYGPYLRPSDFGYPYVYGYPYYNYGYPYFYGIYQPGNSVRWEVKQRQRMEQR